jgi:hypothetical protein
MEHCEKRIGESYFRTPRTTITSFVHFLSVLEQNPGANWQEMLDAVTVAGDQSNGNDGDMDEADELASFQL